MRGTTSGLCLAAVVGLVGLAQPSEAFFGAGVGGSALRGQLPSAQHQHPHRSSRASVGPLASSMFDKAHCIEHLEHDMKHDLALLSVKFGKFITRIEDIEDIHVHDIDGDSMSIDVVYCDRNDDTCVAVEVPIRFPHHCDTEAEIDDAIHELEIMEFEDAKEVKWSGPKAAVDPALAETMRRIEAVMNAEFQTELLSFMRSYSREPLAAAAGAVCEMRELSPRGFRVAATAADGSEAAPAVDIPFERECWTANDFQQQIMVLSERCLAASRA